MLSEHRIKCVKTFNSVSTLQTLNKERRHFKVYMTNDGDIYLVLYKIKILQPKLLTTFIKNLFLYFNPIKCNTCLKKAKYILNWIDKTKESLLDLKNNKENEKFKSIYDKWGRRMPMFCFCMKYYYTITPVNVHQDNECQYIFRKIYW